jgi:hypothetical protein
MMQKAAGGIMRNLAPGAPTRMCVLARLVALLAVALALGACSKCDVPDFTHWGSPTPPHACD